VKIFYPAPPPPPALILIFPFEENITFHIMLNIDLTAFRARTTEHFNEFLHFRRPFGYIPQKNVASNSFHFIKMMIRMGGPPDSSLQLCYFQRFPHFLVSGGGDFLLTARKDNSVSRIQNSIPYGA
jgi:hypothetical protein